VGIGVGQIESALRKTQQLATAPGPFFAIQIAVTVADELLIERAAPSIGFASRALQQRIAGAPSLEVDINLIRFRLAKVNMGVKKVVCNAKNTYSFESVALRLTPPFFLAPAKAYLPVLTVAQPAKANAASAEAQGAIPGED
jgi:hypothetical protein